MAVIASLSLLPSSSSSPFFPNLNLNHSSSSSSSSLISFPLLNLHSKSHASQTNAVSSSSLSLCSSVGVGENLPADYEEWLPKPDPSCRRRAGILLHPTSFRGPFGIGDLGDEAFRFIDWLHQAGCSFWQVLPLVPPGRKANEDGSPYSGQDANCGNTLLISLEELVKDGLLAKSELPDPIL